MPIYIDQADRRITINRHPERIISLVPSQTELLYDLGLEKEVSGITKFCIHPNQWFNSKIRVGGTKQVNLEVVKKIQPDLIIANKEENVKEQIDELAKHFPVWVSNINNLEDAYEMIEKVGIITGKQTRALSLITEIREKFSLLAEEIKQQSLPLVKTAYLIWQKPFMTVGGDTFIHSQLEIAGLDNVFKERKRYPEITIDDLQKSGCDLLLLSSEPYPFKQKNIDEFQRLLPTVKIILADGEMFSWYGSRLLQAASYFISLRNQLK
jgi:ABC-type Fe3+-hydroxamate transport system substrate-binding protein